MRFSAPRSLSPSPVRQFRRSSFRFPSDSEDSDIYQDSEDDEINEQNYVVELSSDSSSSASDADAEDSLHVSFARNVQIISPEKQELNENMSAIRLHVRYNDPYEEWQQRAKREAFLSARKDQAEAFANFRETRSKARLLAQQKAASLIDEEAEDIRKALLQLDMSRQHDEQRLKDAWKERQRKLWEQIDSAIKIEEEKTRAKLEAEQKVREELERKQKLEAEQRMKEEETKRKQEDEKQRKIQEVMAQKEKEERERAEREEAERIRKEQDKGSAVIRETTGVPSAGDIWTSGLHTLRTLKTETMRAVKGPKPPDPLPNNYEAPPAPPLKKLWSAQRRKITPRVGQLTDDPREISRITEELKGIVAPVQGTPEALHYALLSSLAKAIIKQAETEVTAHKEQAVPLAKVAVSLISHYSDFADIFWAKLCELMGCWIVPVAAEPSSESNFMGSNSEKVLAKLWSRREDEMQDAQILRLAGVLRLYCHMLIIPVDKPFPPAFRPARIWTYVVQLLASPALLDRSPTPELLSVILDVGGVEAKAIWGKQWVKLLSFIYDNVQGDQKERIGGKDPAAQASRARCIIDIERILAAS